MTNMSNISRPNVVVVLADQLRACSLSSYGQDQVQTPHIDRLAREGIRFTNAISTCPVCTPYRAMLLTGRHPQTTGHVVNFVRTRSDEISIADALGRSGYRTGWVGKWHLTCGTFLGDTSGPEFIPENRDRLGFEYFRAYNYSTRYFDGWVSLDDWRVEQWRGYETHGLWNYAEEFLNQEDARPFCLFISPHQPHQTSFRPYAPDYFYERVAENLELPANVPQESREVALEMLRHYLAMTAAVDDLLGQVLDYLDKSGQANDTLVVFTSDHGTTGGAHGTDPWMKKLPWEEAINVPLLARWPGVLTPGTSCNELVAPVDLFPTLCTLCDVPFPRSVEGIDLSASWQGQSDGQHQDALLLMDFARHPDLVALKPGDSRIRPHYIPWRGVRTKTHSYVRWLDGQAALYDLTSDPLQLRNLVTEPEAQTLREEIEIRLRQLLALRNDDFPPDEAYESWLDSRRRVVANAHGTLGDPEGSPDWSLFDSNID